MDSLGNEKATLKANELRIGNIVSTDGRCRDIDILILSENDFGNLILFKTWSRIHPIPLTEEWLIRLGFEMSRNASFHRKVGSLSVDLEYNIHWCGRFLMPAPEHVHQLQNLYFALTGQELEVKESARP